MPRDPNPPAFVCACGDLLVWSVAPDPPTNVYLTLNCPRCGERVFVWLRDGVRVLAFRCAGLTAHEVLDAFLERALPQLREFELASSRFRWLPAPLRGLALRRWPPRESSLIAG